MVLKFNKKELISIVAKYYKEELDIDGRVSCSFSKEKVGYGLCETDDCVVSMSIVGKMDLLGETRSMTINIIEDEVKDILKFYLEKEGYIVNQVKYNKGLKEVVSGYGLGERYEKRAYFSGLTVNVIKNERVKKYGN